MADNSVYIVKSNIQNRSQCADATETIYYQIIRPAFGGKLQDFVLSVSLPAVRGVNLDYRRKVTKDWQAARERLAMALREYDDATAALLETHNKK